MALGFCRFVHKVKLTVHLYKQNKRHMNLSDRHIIHCDLDTFFVSVERLRNSKLIGLPILIGGSSDRGVVASCSYEARKYGIHSAMPMKLARQLCPEAILVRGDMDAYSKYSNMVTDIIAEKAPAFEKASIDEHYVDVSGMDRYFGTYKWTQELRRTIIKETGLPISLGLSINKTVSKIATGQAKPNGEIQVQDGTEKPFLAPLSIRTIPMIGDKTYIKLRNMGVSKIQTIQEMDAELMHRVLGENGITIWRKANGIDESPIVPYFERKSISTENTFEKDTIDIAYLKKVISKQVDELSFDLRKSHKVTSCVTVKLRYSNFETFTKQTRIPYTASCKTLTEKCLELFDKLYSRRMLIRLVGVKFSHLVSGNFQIDLFNDVGKQINLDAAMDSIRNRFGVQYVKKAVTL